MRSRTKSPEEAERMLRETGRLVRPLRLSDVKLGQTPKKMTIVANAKERRTAADTLHLYHVSKLQARVMAYREVHPVWGHERVLIFGKMQSEFMQSDASLCSDQHYAGPSLCCQPGLASLPWLPSTRFCFGRGLPGLPKTPKKKCRNPWS